MPNGVPVATVALNGAKNAGILTAQIIGSFDENVAQKVQAYKEQIKNEVEEKVRVLKAAGHKNDFDV
jgi:5-(carboxyamino)imidazole ribonucleotide mutase